MLVSKVVAYHLVLDGMFRCSVPSDVPGVWVQESHVADNFQ